MKKTAKETANKETTHKKTAPVKTAPVTDYKEMLSRAYASLPKDALGKERFQMPAVDSFIQGPKTIVKNFGKIVKDLHREHQHALRFVTKELATASAIEGDSLTLNGKFPSHEMQKLIEEYINRFVLCGACKRPDTKIVDQKGVKMLKCEACGATSPVRD